MGLFKKRRRLHEKENLKHDLREEDSTRGPEARREVKAILRDRGHASYGFLIKLELKQNSPVTEG